MLSARPLALTLTLCAASATAQAPAAKTQRFPHHGPVAVFAGVPGAYGDVHLYDVENGVAHATPRELADLHLLPIDFVGRTELETFAPDRARLRQDVPGASRLELPGRSGYLYRYERRVPAGAVFGYLWVRPEGGVAVRAERAGVGPAGIGDPFGRRIAVDPGGAAFLVATTLDAGGDLIEVDVETGVETDRTPHLAPLDVSDASLWLHAEWGFAIATGGLVRFERTPGAVATSVAFVGGSPPTWFSGQAVVSQNRGFALTTAGAAPDRARPFVFGRGGDAREVEPTERRLSGAGFLPESPHGPYMAVDDDGLTAAWRVEGASREVMLGRLAAPAVEVTGDAFFLDTLDEIGEMFFARIGRLIAAIGELHLAPGGSGFEAIDVFHIELDAGGAPRFTNITLTSGDAAAPFDVAGDLEPELVRWIPGGEALLMQDSNTECLLAADPGVSGARLLLDAAKDVDFVELVGDHVVAGVRRELDPRRREIHRFDADLSNRVRLVVDSGDVEYSHAVARSRDTLGYRTSDDFGLGGAFRLRVTDGTLEAFPGGPARYLGPTGYTARGAQLVTQGPVAGPVLFFAWPRQGSPLTLRAPSGPGFVLPGR